jgi:hypothetical protein
MDYDLLRSKKSIKRVESTKSNPWWWDSHIGLKNSKWLENNLDGESIHIMSFSCNENTLLGLGFPKLGG